MFDFLLALALFSAPRWFRDWKRFAQMKQFGAAILFLGVAHAFAAVEITARPFASNQALDQNGELGVTDCELRFLSRGHQEVIFLSPDLGDLINLSVRPQQNVIRLQVSRPDDNPLAVLARACSRGWISAKAASHPVQHGVSLCARQGTEVLSDRESPKMAIGNLATVSDGRRSSSSGLSVGSQNFGSAIATASEFAGYIARTDVPAASFARTAYGRNLSSKPEKSANGKGDC